MNRSPRPSAGPRFAGWRTTAVLVAGTLLGSEACAGLLGIDAPDVVGGDGGVGASDATVDVGADAPGERDAQLPGDAQPEDGGADSRSDSNIDAAADGGADSEPPPSCAKGGAGVDDCAAGGDCCASPLVEGGTFSRDYDGLKNLDAGNPATVSDFRLDQYEVTVGRFRPFVTALNDGWVPDAGSGKHAHLDGGGLVMPLDDGGAIVETGWSSSWDVNLNGTLVGPLCGGAGPTTWTEEPDAGNENQPINCVTWYDAYAFCIWDGGFLPSEAEWNYAAAGGQDQRLYPWSDPPRNQSADCSYANYHVNPDGGTCTPVAATVPVGSFPKGQGLWGQQDISGNVWEWTADSNASTLLNPCVNCANLTPGPDASVLRGGGYGDVQAGMYASVRYRDALTVRYSNYGIRCARSP
jgi:formylglycine-generating enzyme required for sulfatase activity